MTDVFITNSNFSKLANFTKISLDEGMSEICARIYGYKDISKYLNHREITDVECKRLLIEDSEAYIKKFLEIQKNSHLIDGNKKITSDYLFVSSGPPKFHTNKTCEFLRKDYNNFLIPPEISERGEVEKNKFREFARANKNLLTNNKEDVFVFKLKTQFHLNSDISKINYTNSGSKQFNFGDELDVENEINKVMEDIDCIGREPDGVAALREYIYADHYRADKISEISDLGGRVLKLKSHLINLLIKYHLRKNSKENFSFSRNLLENLGYVSCMACDKS